MGKVDYYYTRWDVFVTIDGEEEQVLAKHPAKTEADAIRAGEGYLLNPGFTPKHPRLTKAQRESATVRVAQRPTEESA
jgi:hypothetical protein